MYLNLCVKERKMFLKNADRSFLVANAHQGLCHIIYCSDGFCRLTGFSRAEVMQRPAVCEFLHGPMTSPHAVAALRDALAAGVEKHFEILYYRKDGEINSTPSYYYSFIDYPRASIFDNYHSFPKNFPNPICACAE